MSWNHSGFNSSKDTNTSSKYSFINYVKKPIEIYVFVDPLCPECWSLEPYLKKLWIEYGRLFTIRLILSTNLNPLQKKPFHQPPKLKDIWEKTAKRTGMSCDGDLWDKNPVFFPWITSLAIKAAELQGKRAGRTFLRKVQEAIFLRKENITDENILIQCAKDVQLDVQEFKNDLYSSSAKKALQCDFKLTMEMDVDFIPSIVFFNQEIEQEGIKVSGLYPYDIYVRVLTEVLQKEVNPAHKPPLKQFVAYYQVVASKEVAVVYDWSLSKADREMKKLQLKQVVKRIPAKHGSFWEYCGK
ncbi:MAG TPA: ClpXP adapter SpxH family protein [Bacillota bacterium]